MARLDAVELPGLGDALQVAASGVREPDAGSRHEVAHRAGDEDLAGCRLRHDPCAEVHGHATQPCTGTLAFARVQPDAQLEPELKRLGLSAYAVASAPNVKTHLLDVPRIGYVHSWSRTQDEGWWRAAFDHYGVPYTYFGEPELKKGNLRAK